MTISIVLKDKMDRIVKAPLRIYDSIERDMVDHRTVKVSMVAALLVYHALLVLGVIFAQWTPDWSAIDGYTIWDNWISDLGGSKYTVPHTPLPILYDLACVFAGALTIPLTFFLEGIVAPRDSNMSRWRLRLASLGFLFGLVGNIGYIGVGVFSEDRNFWGLHGITSALAFGGFVVSGFFIALCALIYRTRIPKKVGIYMLFVPPMTIVLQALPAVVPAVSGPLMEWMLLFSILGWVDPLSIITLAGFRREEEIRKHGGAVEPPAHQQKGMEWVPVRRFLRKKLDFLKMIADRLEGVYTDEKVFKVVAWAGIVACPALLLAGILVAAPGGFSIGIDAPTALGSVAFTPAPWLFDAFCIVIGVLAIPAVYYFEKQLAPLPDQLGGDLSRPRYKLTTYGLVLGILGSFGFVILGIFSRDRPVKAGHYTVPVFAYAEIAGCIAFALAFMCIGECILLYETGHPKVLGLYGLLGPFIALVAWAATRTALAEWLVLFAIIAFMVLLLASCMARTCKAGTGLPVKGTTKPGDGK
ncbi:MAG: DUF998 domain-containing protein [Candidatus Sigynarchaeota archaeon]